MRTYKVNKAAKKKQRKPLDVDFDVWDIVALSILVISLIFVAVGICVEVWAADVSYKVINNVVPTSRTWTLGELYARLSTWSGRGFITAARIMGGLAIAGVALVIIERVLECFITLPKALPFILAAFTVATAILAIVFAYVVSVNCFDVLAESLNITDAIESGVKTLTVYPIQGMWLTAAGGVMAGASVLIKR